MNDFFVGIIEYTRGINTLEFLGLVFGLVTVILLIRQDIKNWFFGIAYVLVSFVIFWQSRLYGDFLLHIVFLILNIYGWYNWSKPPQNQELKVSLQNNKERVISICLTAVGVLVFAQFLIGLPSIFENLDPASLPYWDSTTTVLSITAMILTAQKKLENWIYWFAVDVLSTGIYFYKELYFYSLLYFIYIGFAVWGYRSWLNSYRS